MSAHILVVDDSKLDRYFIRRLLEFLGVECDEADGGKECLKLARTNEYEVILMDYLMPVMNGVDTMQQLRSGIDSRNESTPVIALVDDDDPSEGRVCMEAGFDNYLEKPVAFKQLIAVLIMYLPDNIRKKLSLPEVNAQKAMYAEDKAPAPAKKPAKKAGKDSGDDKESSLLENIRKIDDIDIDQGISLCGSKEGYLTAITIFYNSIDSKADEIEEYYRMKDYVNYTIKVHALKSSGNLIGADKLRADAKEMEDAGNASDIDLIEEKTGDLLEYYRGFKEKLDFLSLEDKKEKPKADAASIADAYNSLLEFADAMDFDLAMMVVDSMKEYELSEADAAKFAKIEEYVSNLDWDKIKETINEGESS